MSMPTTRVPFNALDRQHCGDLKAHISQIADRIVSGGWYVLGKEVAAFEQEFAAYCGVHHAVGVASGSDALELAIACLDLPDDCEIAVAPNAAMYATLAILANQKIPRFVDVDVASATLDPASLEAALTPATRAVVVTHLYGRLADMDVILAIAERHGLAVIEDCAQAHGAMHRGRHAGSFGQVGCFSFYPTKNLGALGDGGAVVTDDNALAESLRQLRQYGWQRKYDVTLAHGRNSRLDELQAAFLRAKLPLLNNWNQRRREVAHRYSSAIRHPGIVVPDANGGGYVGHLYVVRCERREALREHLASQGIGVDVHYPIPDHRQRVFGDRYRNLALPVAEHWARTALSLPCFPELEDDEIAAVIDTCNGWKG
jgi:dTDP-4-amino-4,6-dideoxygalactose transaminase